MFLCFSFFLFYHHNKHPNPEITPTHTETGYYDFPPERGGGMAPPHVFDPLGRSGAF